MTNAFHKAKSKLWVLGRLNEPRTDLRSAGRERSSSAEFGAKAGTFETRGQVRCEDGVRQAALLRACADPSALLSAKAAELARRLKPPKRAGTVVDSFASAKSFRVFRRIFAGHVLDLVAQVPKPISLYTIVTAEWRIKGCELLKMRPKLLLEQFRAQLNRRGLGKLSGWLVASVHGDFDPDTGTFQIHLHVIAVGDVRFAIEQLRASPRYKPGEIKRPILRRNASDLKRRVPYYVGQLFWPMRVPLSGGGRSPRRRLPPTQLVDWLLWMDKQSFGDLVWLHGCRIEGGKLVAKRSPDEAWNSRRSRRSRPTHGESVA
ncbi:hypothetical protein NKH85_24935 [Mesorhizobium sp. M0924]|uniref:hypothetical protein n=1 Tax=unclassified Mesorhizobium TaxID=325217 RepID=UPI00333C9820